MKTVPLYFAFYDIRMIVISKDAKIAYLCRINQLNILLLLYIDWFYYVHNSCSAEICSASAINVLTCEFYK
jgi:hypothetical protein